METPGYLKIVMFVILSLLNVALGRHTNVAVIGGGVAGLAAARVLSNDRLNRFLVQVYEAKRERYGGRVWTKRNLSANSKEIEADLGAMFLNSKIKDNPLIELIKKFEIEKDSIGPLEFYTSSNSKIHQGHDLTEAMRKAKELMLSAIEKAKRKGKDISVREAVNQEIFERGLEENSLTSVLIKALPSYNINDYSALLYAPDQLDFGYDTIVKFGLAELVDRIVGGFEAEAPLDINLRHVVRQIKVDDKRKQILVRFRDGRQISVDAVIVAVPMTVLQNDSLLFEPPLPKEFYKTLHELKLTLSERIVVEFDEMFWPQDKGMFVMTPEKSSDAGFLTTWINLNKVNNKAYLAGSIGHQAVDKFYSMTDETIADIALNRLKKLFGDDVVRQHNVTNLLRSDWLKSLYIGGSSAYPSVGNTGELWDVFDLPVCPGIYFAGEYTTLDGLGTLHGAYNSGVKAAEALMSGYCEQKAREEQELKEKNLKASEKSNKTVDSKKDEL
ncbi:hypothetical protein SNE40_009974 [Patella caerulea]|uniref:Amine oxidase n=1 Tax=Patella caerulea TaxID=87958 RepID=A0AAN8PSD3_PATCE